jgi:hypothetical protein
MTRGTRAVILFGAVVLGGCASAIGGQPVSPAFTPPDRAVASARNVCGQRRSRARGPGRGAAGLHCYQRDRRIVIGATRSRPSPGTLLVGGVCNKDLASQLWDCDPYRNERHSYMALNIEGYSQMNMPVSAVWSTISKIYPGRVSGPRAPGSPGAGPRCPSSIRATGGDSAVLCGGFQPTKPTKPTKPQRLSQREATRGLMWNRTVGRPPSRAITASGRIQPSSRRHASASPTTRGSVSPVQSLR